MVQAAVRSCGASAATDGRYKQAMKTIAVMASSLIAFSVFGAAPYELVRTVRSSTSQFIVRGPTFSQVQTNSSVADSTWLELDPNILAVSCERIKQALLRELTLPDLWRGRIRSEERRVGKEWRAWWGAKQQ